MQAHYAGVHSNLLLSVTAPDCQNLRSMGESSKASDRNQGRVLAYDGDCGLCRAVLAGLHGLRLVPRERSRTIQSFEGELAQRLIEAGVHDELAVWDPESDEIRTGSDGLLWALETSWSSPLLPLARIGPVRAGLRLSYRWVAYNRRLLSPPKPGLRCACDPSHHPAYRWALVVMAFVAATLLAFASAHIAGPAPRWNPSGGLLVGALAVAPCALFLRGEARVDFLGHLGLATFWSQLMIVLAGLAFQPLGEPRLSIVPAVLASVVLAVSLSRRLAVQGLGRHWMLASLALFVTGWVVAISLG